MFPESPGGAQERAGVPLTEARAQAFFVASSCGYSEAGSAGNKIDHRHFAKRGERSTSLRAACKQGKRYVNFYVAVHDDHCSLSVLLLHLSTHVGLCTLPRPTAFDFEIIYVPQRQSASPGGRGISFREVHDRNLREGAAKESRRGDRKPLGARLAGTTEPGLLAREETHELHAVRVRSLLHPSDAVKIAFFFRQLCNFCWAAQCAHGWWRGKLPFRPEGEAEGSVCP